MNRDLFMLSGSQNFSLTKLTAVRAGLPLDLAFSLVVATLSCQAGTPWVAFPVIAAVNLLLTALLRAQRSAWLGQALAFCRRVPKAVQLLIVAMAVTGLFAFEKQVDVVPNAFGFVELVAPTVAAAILFDVSGGLFSAALIAVYGFQVFAPPRFEAILDITSLTLTLGAFGFVSLLTALHLSAASAAWARQLGVPEEWTEIFRQSRRGKARAAEGAVRTFRQLVDHALVPCALVVGYGLCWSIFAWISSGNGLHIDSLEAYAWGREFGLGYYKHPPFWAWIAGTWFAIFPKTDWAFWFLSELNAGLGLAGAWAVMGRFCNQRTRLLAVLLLMLTPFYQFNAQRFNANTILLSLWPWTIYFFIRSLETTRLAYAVACGVLAGCALLSKYFAVILIVTCFVAALTHDSRERYFKSAAPYVSVIVAALVFSPHVLWMVRNGFQPLVYLAEKIDLADRHISNSYFQFIGAQILFFGLPALILLGARWKYGRQSHSGRIALENGPSFLAVLAIAPFILTLLAGTVGHAALAVPFGVPIFALVPLCLILLLQATVEPTLRWAKFSVAGLTATCLLASPFLPHALARWGGAGYREPRNEVADEAMQIWQAETQLPLRYVSGERPYSLAVTFRSRGDVSEFNEFNSRRSPWVTPEAIKRHGLLVICRSSDVDCLSNSQPFETARTRRLERAIGRKIGVGVPVPFTIIVIPPAEPATSS